MKRRILPGILVAACIGGASGAQRSGPSAPGAFPTLRGFALQVLHPFHEPGPVTLALRLEGELYVLDLEPYDLRATDFRVLLEEGGVLREIEAPEVTTYRGVVHDASGAPVDGARVAASRIPAGWNLSVALPHLEETLFVQPVSDLVPELGAPGLHAVYAGADVRAVPGICANPESEPFGFDPEEGAGEADPPVLAATSQPTVWIAFDTDAEYFELHGSDPAAVVAQIEGLMNQIELLFERDTRVTFEVTTIIVRTTGTGGDPYASTSAAGLLQEMTDHWNARQGGIRRALAHLVTGRALTGDQGASNERVLCRPSSAYAVSRPDFTTNLRLRIALVAHHIGHVFGARHCDGSLLENGKKCLIMCSVLGGCDGVGRPTFGSPARGFIARNAVGAGCNHPEPPPAALPFVDDFPADPPDPGKWLFNDRAEVIARANTAEPSEPAALKLNASKDAPGFQDDIRTVFVDASRATGLELSFMTQRKGVEAGEELVVEYVAAGVPGWTELGRLTSDGTDEAGFHLESFVLPADARHAELRIRLRLEADEGDDRWFVDDLVLAEPGALTSGPFTAGETGELTATGAFPGSPVAFYCSLGERSGFELGPSDPVGLVGVAEADERGRAALLVHVPAGTCATEALFQAVRLRPLTGEESLSEVVAVRIEPEPSTSSATGPSSSSR